jgi:hypothetical protein
MRVFRNYRKIKDGAYYYGVQGNVQKAEQMIEIKKRESKLPNGFNGGLYGISLENVH